jgi:hypothetical protein
VAADKSDDSTVLGNLPRSRPGHRSNKRGSGSGNAPEPAAVTAEAKEKASPAKAVGSSKAGARKTASPSTRAKAARAKTAAKSPRAKPAARAKAAPARPARERPARPRPQPLPQPEHQDGPLSGAVRVVGKVADVGLRTAGGLLRRLPGR